MKIEQDWIKIRDFSLKNSSYLIASVSGSNVVWDIDFISTNNDLKLVPKIVREISINIDHIVIEDCTCIKKFDFNKTTEQEVQEITGFSKKTFEFILNKKYIFFENPIRHSIPSPVDYMDNYEQFPKDLAGWRKYDPKTYFNPIIFKIVWK